MNSSERTSKPSTSMKRPREPEEKEASKPSSKKSKKLAQEDNKGKAPEAEKSVKKGGPIWTPKDEVAFLKRLVACCEKGKGVPKNLGVFYETVRKDLDGGYNHDQLYNKLRGLRLKFDKNKDKIKDKIFVGFKDEHEESLYRMSKQIWGNREGDAEVGTEKAGKGGDGRVEKKNNNLGREREEVERNRNGEVGMASKEEGGEEDESDEEEGEGEGHKGSSEDNGGEEENSSDEGEESGSETTGDENSALPDSNAAQGLSERRKFAALGHHDDAHAGENLRRPVQDGKPDGRKRITPTNLPNNEENLAQHAPTGMANRSPCVGMTEQLQMFDQPCKENMRILNSQLQDKLDGFKNEIVNMVKKELKSSNNARPTGFDFSMIEELFSARELTSLSKTEAEMLDHKWRTQKYIEMDAASKRLALMLEEYQLRMAKFSHR